METDHQDQATAETMVQDKNREEIMDRHIQSREKIQAEATDHLIEDNLLHMMTEDNHLLQIEDLLLKVETMVKQALGLVAAEVQTMHLELLSRWKMKEDLPLLQRTRRNGRSTGEDKENKNLYGYLPLKNYLIVCM